MAIGSRIDRLERLVPEERPAIMFSVIYDSDPPDWATEALRPYLRPHGVSIVTWQGDPDTLTAEIAGRGTYRVTPDGCAPLEATDAVG